MQTYSIRVSGLVQGVGFRYFVYQQAKALNVKGYVQNKINGDVYIMAEAPEFEMKAFVEQIKKGPTRSRVDRISVDVISALNFDDFQII